MIRRETSQDIDEAASAWVARIDRGPLTDAEREALEAWLASDLRRQGAFARANAVMARVDEARHSTLDTSYALRGAALRRRQLIGGGLAAACAGVAVLGAKSWSAPLVLRSSKGEIRRVPLPDGSNVTLNTESLLKVRYSRRSRDVQLLSGEALFNVATDQRPFVVEAGDVRLRGGGTSFVVRKDDRGPVRVMVQTGHVEMTCKGAPSPLLVAANAAAVVPQAGFTNQVAPSAPVALDADEVARRLSWQDGLLAFNGETLGQAAAEFARYSSTRIVIDDPTLAAEPLSGLYASSDPGGFARDVALSFGARTVSAADGVHIVR